MIFIIETIPEQIVILCDKPYKIGRSRLFFADPLIDKDG
jgi:hypothetical protein